MPSDTFAAGIKAAARVAEKIVQDYAARVRSTSGKYDEDADACLVSRKIATAIRRLTPTDTDTAIPAGWKAWVGAIEDVFERLRGVSSRNRDEYSEICNIIDTIRRLTPTASEATAIGGRD